LSDVVHSTVLGRLDEFDVGERAVERVIVGSDDLAKRILRFATSAGDIGVRFFGVQRLRDGDVIYADERVVIAVLVEADDVLVLRPATIAAAIGLAHALGNRHLPIHADGDAIVVRYDPLLEPLAAEHHVPASRERRVLPKAFRHANAPHRHE
jgi:urease accessory protein